MIYEILNKEGKVINRVIAGPDFVEKQYKGLYRDVTPEPVIEEEKAPVKTLEEKVDELTAKVDALITAVAVKP
jgi:hypothetical protein